MREWHKALKYFFSSKQIAVNTYVCHLDSFVAKTLQQLR